MISIMPLELVYPILALPFFVPVTVWHLLTPHATALGCNQAVKPFFEWLRVYMRPPAWAIVGLTSVDLSDVTLQQFHSLAENLVPKPLPPPPARYLPPVPVMWIPVNYPPPQSQCQPDGPAERWGDNFQSLLRICKVTREEDLLAIWNTVSPLKEDRSQRRWMQHAASLPKACDSARQGYPDPLQSLCWPLPFTLKTPIEWETQSTCFSSRTCPYWHVQRRRS